MASKTDDFAVYYELSPKLVWLVRVVNIFTLLMVIISVILCFVQGPKNNAFYLLVCNLVISGLVCMVVNWWYKRGDLGSEKFWFVLLICAVIVVQCISSDIFLFKKEEEGTPTTPTTTRGPTSHFPWTSMIPPSVQPNITTTKKYF